MDAFEKHIRNNKEFFEEKAPNRLKMWEEIEGGLDQGEHVHDTAPKAGSSIMGIMLLLLVIIGVILGVTELTKQNSEPALMAKPSKELNAIDQYYTQMVSYQITQLKASDHLSDLDKDDFLAYIKELTDEQVELKAKLEKNINNEALLEAIIENFNQQIKLIQHLLERVNNSNNIEDETGIYI